MPICSCAQRRVYRACPCDVCSGRQPKHRCIPGGCARVLEQMLANAKGRDDAARLQAEWVRMTTEAA